MGQAAQALIVTEPKCPHCEGELPDRGKALTPRAERLTDLRAKAMVGTPGAPLTLREAAEAAGYSPHRQSAHEVLTKPDAQRALQAKVQAHRDKATEAVPLLRKLRGKAGKILDQRLDEGNVTIAEAAGTYKEVLAAEKQILQMQADGLGESDDPPEIAAAKQHHAKTARLLKIARDPRFSDRVARVAYAMCRQSKHGYLYPA